MVLARASERTSNFGGTGWLLIKEARYWDVDMVQWPSFLNFGYLQ